MIDCKGLDVEIPHPALGSVRLRRPKPQDKPRVVEFLKRLSRESIFHRFFRLIRDYGEVVDKMLGGHDTLYCVLAEVGGEVVACAELYKTTWPDTGEPAVAVLDRYQGMGLGKLLVMLLAHCALQMGLSKFRAYTLKDNRPIIRIASKLSPRVLDDLGDSILLEMRLVEARESIHAELSRWDLDP